VAASPAGAAALALAAGLDVELPSVRCFGEPLRAAVAAGQVPVELIDRAAARVLRQKVGLGLLDPGWQSVPTEQAPDLDPSAQRTLARRLAEESVVLLANPGGVLPLASGGKVAVIGPLADDQLAFFGCYSMPRHLGHLAKGGNDGPGVPVSTLLEALREEQFDVCYAQGCPVTGDDTSGFDAAMSAALEADVVIAVVGDEAGLFGRGTSGEGCDVADLRLPGVQEELLTMLIATRKPVVAVLVTGRPYAIGNISDKLAAIVQTFFPGEEGGHAIADVLTGRVAPSGKLPIEVPRIPGAQPSPYLRTRNAGWHAGSSVDPTPLFAFGHGLSYTTFEYADLELSASEIPTDGTVEISCTVRNTGLVAGTEVVQLYLSDPVSQVVRPVRWLAGFARAPLGPGEAQRVAFRLHADRTSFTGLSGKRIVEPGDIEVAIGGASDDLPLSGTFTLTGRLRTVGVTRVLDTPASVHELPG
jgi:beta-xylosidase